VLVADCVSYRGGEEEKRPMNGNQVLRNTQTEATPKREKRRRGCLAWAGIVAGVLALVLALFVGWTWVSGTKAKQELAANYPPPGQMVDVGGYRLHINCQGRKQSDDSPTVVLEAGATQFSLTWDHVQREVAKFARVCAYDRAGLGWSERSPNPRTAPYIVAELHALLTKAGVEPPYVLVGHSMGGLYVRYYAHEHGERVVGIKDVVTGVKVQLYQLLVAPSYRVEHLAGRVYADFQFVEVTIGAQNDAAPLRALRRRPLDFDAIGEERTGEGWEGVELGDGLVQQIAELPGCRLDDHVGLCLAGHRIVAHGRPDRAISLLPVEGSAAIIEPLGKPRPGGAW